MGTEVLCYLGNIYECSSREGTTCLCSLLDTSLGYQNRSDSQNWKWLKNGNDSKKEVIQNWKWFKMEVNRNGNDSKMEAGSKMQVTQDGSDSKMKLVQI